MHRKEHHRGFLLGMIVGSPSECSAVVLIHLVYAAYFGCFRLGELPGEELCPTLLEPSTVRQVEIGSGARPHIRRSASASQYRNIDKSPLEVMQIVNIFA